jgi:Coenzyme PQQ synthesis protein D (PqqD)
VAARHFTVESEGVLMPESSNPTSVENPASGSTLRPRRGVVARDMNGSAVLVHLETNRIYELNATGARVWALLEQGLDRPAICLTIGSEFGVTGAEMEQAVDDLLTELAREGLIGG